MFINQPVASSFAHHQKLLTIIFMFTYIHISSDVNKFLLSCLSYLSLLPEKLYIYIILLCLYIASTFTLLYMDQTDTHYGCLHSKL